MKESDLYQPLKQFLESQGYEVKGEVRECDVIAVRGTEDPVIVELKLSINLGVVLQAVDRLSMSSAVYVGVPISCSALKRQRRHIFKLFKMLGLGLILIDPHANSNGAQVLFDPGEYRPRKSKSRRERLLGEFAKRIGDPNTGGQEKRRGIMTFYRQRALRIAGFLQENGPSRVRDIAKELDDSKAGDILYKDVYGWFDRVSRGVYTISPRGTQEVPLWII